MPDRDTIEQLFSTYAWGIDAREFELLNEVFTEDASFSVKIAGEVALAVEGRKQVVDLIATTTREQTDQRRHNVSNLYLEGDDRANANLTLLVVEGGTLETKSCGVYRTTLAEEGGKVRFRTMALSLDVPF
jgi:ketosteroid isomerase-like protein